MSFAVSSMQKDLARLGPLAMLGVGSVGVFAASAVLLWVVAAWQVRSVSSVVRWMPHFAILELKYELNSQRSGSRA